MPYCMSVHVPGSRPNRGKSGKEKSGHVPGIVQIVENSVTEKSVHVPGSSPNCREIRRENLMLDWDLTQIVGENHGGTNLIMSVRSLPTVINPSPAFTKTLSAAVYHRPHPTAPLNPSPKCPTTPPSQQTSSHSL